MHNWMRGAVIAIVASAATAIVVSADESEPGRRTDARYEACRVRRDGKAEPEWRLADHRDGALGSAGSSGPIGPGARASAPWARYPRAGVVEGTRSRTQPWAAAKKKENARQLGHQRPGGQVLHARVPRATYMPFPFQIVQTAEQHPDGVRVRQRQPDHQDRKVVDPAPVDTWMGQSAGSWEGDTLVVDVTSFNDQTWFDRAGNFHSEALHVVERYTPCQPRCPRLPGHDRGSESLHAAVEDQHAALSAAGHERAAPRVQVRRVRRGDDVRQSARRRRGTEKPFSAARLGCVAYSAFVWHESTKRRQPRRHEEHEYKNKLAIRGVVLLRELRVTGNSSRRSTGRDHARVCRLRTRRLADVSAATSRDSSRPRSASESSRWRRGRSRTALFLSGPPKVRFWGFREIGIVPRCFPCGLKTCIACRSGRVDAPRGCPPPGRPRRIADPGALPAAGA